MSSQRLNALILAGGHSRRMGSDKAGIEIDGQSLIARTFVLASEFCEVCRVSVRPDQMNDPLRAGLNPLPDTRPGEGPLAGILAAFESDPTADWLVLACDMPGLSREGIQWLVDAARDIPEAPAVSLTSPDSDLPEPLCAIWRPALSAPVVASLDAGRRCARKLLINAGAALVPAPSADVVANMNTPQDRDAWTGAIS
ncbi:MAG: molybdenum cofactor guanylyltransferase [Pseudomonadota bacterium]